MGMGALDLPERHQSLKAAIDWSYESLPPAEGQFLRRLAVFSGGFSLKAAEIVGGCEALALDGLGSLITLVEKGLIIKTRGPGGETRFTLLESIRDYLLDRLRASGGLDGVRRRHSLYYLELAERNYSEMKKGNRNSWLNLLEIEHDNLRAALQWSLDAGEYFLGKRIAAALWTPFWCLHGHIREGVRWLEIFLESGGESRDGTHMRDLEGTGTRVDGRGIMRWEGRC